MTLSYLRDMFQHVKWLVDPVFHQEVMWLVSVDSTVINTDIDSESDTDNFNANNTDVQNIAMKKTCIKTAIKIFLVIQQKT